MDTCPVIDIWRDDMKVTINVTDYDPDEHTIYDNQDVQITTKPTSKPDEPEPTSSKKGK